MTTHLGPTRILIADDQEDVRSGFRLILGSQPDMSVVGEAADGLTAVDLARALRPDLVLADIRMPGVDGLELTRRLAGPGCPTRYASSSSPPSTTTATYARHCTTAPADSCSNAQAPAC